VLVFSIVFDNVDPFPSFCPETALEDLLSCVISVFVIVIF
jgi:hypothetical protein